VVCCLFIGRRFVMLHASRQLSLQHRLDQLDTTLSDVPGYFFIKSVDGRYIYLNQAMRHASSCGSGFELLGKRDEAAPWERYAPIYNDNHKKVLAANCDLRQQDPFRRADKHIEIVVVHLKPFHYDGQLVGVFGNSLSVPFDQLERAVCFSQVKAYIDIRKKWELILTERQKEVLFWLLKGSSAKLIAARLHISKRTVEHHLEAIKAENGYTTLKDILLFVRAV
jgi:PAS domain-containing protein